MPQLEQIICPRCRHLERPEWTCDLCGGIGYYTPADHKLRAELKGIIDWLDFNYGGETNEEKVNSYLNATERYE